MHIRRKISSRVNTQAATRSPHGQRSSPHRHPQFCEGTEQRSFGPEPRGRATTHLRCGAQRARARSYTMHMYSRQVARLRFSTGIRASTHGGLPTLPVNAFCQLFRRMIAANPALAAPSLWRRWCRHDRFERGPWASDSSFQRASRVAAGASPLRSAPQVRCCPAPRLRAEAALLGSLTELGVTMRARPLAVRRASVRVVPSRTPGLSRPNPVPC